MSFKSKFRRRIKLSLVVDINQVVIVVILVVATVVVVAVVVFVLVIVIVPWQLRQRGKIPRIETWIKAQHRIAIGILGNIGTWA